MQYFPPFPQSESGTIQRGYSDLTELIADYIRKKENNGLACALIHPVPPDRQENGQENIGMSLRGFSHIHVAQTIG